MALLDDLGDALLEVVQPLIDALASPALFAALLRRNGWRPPPIEEDVAAVSAAFRLGGDVEQSVSHLRDLVANTDTLPSELAAAVDAIGKVWNDLKALGRPPGTFPSPFDRDDFWTAFPPDLVQDLFLTYLERAHPLLFAPLHLLGVLDETTVPPPPGDRVRVPYSKREVRWDRIPILLSHPESLTHDIYGWGGALDHDRLLGRLERVLLALRLQAARLPPIHPLVARYYPPDHPPPAALRQLRFPLFAEQGRDGAIEIGIEVLPVPDSPGGDVRGLAISPYASGQTAATMPIGGPFTLALRGGLEAESAAVQISPGRANAVFDSAATTVDAGATLSAATQQPWILLGSEGSDRVELTDLTFALELAGAADDQDLKLRLHSGALRIVIDPSGGDGFLQAVFGDQPKTIGMGGDLVWSSKHGLSFAGQAGLRLTVPIHQDVGAAHIDEATIEISTPDGGVRLSFGITGGGQLGPVSASVQDLGLELALTPVEAPARGTFGDLDLQFGFKSPTGAGLAIDVVGLVGGGFLDHDQAKQEYSGLLQLSFHSYKLTAFGLISTVSPTGPGYSLIAMVAAEFPPIQLGLGFMLTGAGGLLGVDRTASVDALRAGLTAHTLSNLLFPKNPIANAPQLLTELDTLFPAATGRFLFGPLVHIEWGTPALLTLDLALVLELPDPVRLVLIAELAVLLPTPKEKLVEIHVSALGTVDFGACTGALDAVLHDSHLMNFTLHGAMALRVAWAGQKSLVLAIGGVHPKFQPPPGFPKLERIGISMPSGHITRLNLDGYLAVTTCTLQIGAHVDLFVGVDGFGISGYLTFDTLIQRHPFHFDGDISGGVTLSVDGNDVMALRLDGALSGPGPWHATGSVSFDVMWWTVTKSFSETFGDSADSALPEQVDVGALLRTALGDARNFHAEMLPGMPALVSLKAPVLPETVVQAAPDASLTVRQTVVPLGLTISQYGGAAPAGDARFDITALTADGVAQSPPAVVDDFVPAQYLTLSDEEKLARPSFEALTAGVELRGSTTLGTALARGVAYETFYIDTPDGPVRDESGVVAPLPYGVLVGVMFDGAAGRALLEHSRSQRYAGLHQVVMPAVLDYVVATTDEYKTAGVGAASGASYSEAQAALAAELALHPERAGTLQVAPRYEVAA